MAKRIKQFINPDIGHKLLTNEIVISLGIHALPGTEIRLNDSTGTLTIGPTGNFSIDCEDFPISQIEVLNQINNLQSTIIDIIYREGGDI